MEKNKESVMKPLSLLHEPVCITFLVPEYLVSGQSFESILYEIAESERENASTCCFLKARELMESFCEEKKEQKMECYVFSCNKRETLRLYYFLHHYFGFDEIKVEPRVSFGLFILLAHYLYRHKKETVL